MKIADLRGLIYLCAVFATSCSGSVKQPHSALNEASCTAAWFQGKCVDAGDAVFFGQYPQATDTPEAIQWRVLEVDRTERKLLLLSEYVIDAKAFDENHRDSRGLGIYPTWAKSDIRKWLNGTESSQFLSTSNFSTQEIALIVEVTNSTSDNYDKWDKLDNDGGVDTKDKVFLLDLVDAQNKSYFAKNAVRATKATLYAIRNGAGVNTDEGIYNSCANIQCHAPWWLRAPGYGTSNAMIVTYRGIIELNGSFVGTMLNGIYDKPAIGVRPAMWVKY